MDRREPAQDGLDLVFEVEPRSGGPVALIGCHGLADDEFPQTLKGGHELVFHRPDLRRDLCLYRAALAEVRVDELNEVRQVAPLEGGVEGSVELGSGVGDQLGDAVDAARGQVRVERVLDQPLELGSGFGDHLAGGAVGVGDAGGQARRDGLGAVGVESRVNSFEQLSLRGGQGPIELVAELGELSLHDLDVPGDAHGPQAGHADGDGSVGQFDSRLWCGIAEEGDDVGLLARDSLENHPLLVNIYPRGHGNLSSSRPPRWRLRGGLPAFDLEGDRERERKAPGCTKLDKVYPHRVNRDEVRIGWVPVDAVRNPYTPGAGSRPPVLSGRDAQLDAFRILLERLRLGRPEKSLMMTGLRGVGKTVLLGTLDGIAEEAGFRTASAEITHETDFSSLMARLTRRALLSLSPAGRFRAKARRAAAVLKAFTLRLPDGLEIGVDVDAAVGRGDSGNLADDLADVLVELGKAAADRHSGVVFLFDEIQFLGRRDFEALISSLHQCTQHNLPVTLVGAGLPQLPTLAGAAKSYAERMFDFPVIDRLDETAASAALELPAVAEGAGFEPDATRRIIEFTDGYPYFLQEYGKHVWNIATGPVITVADVAQAEPIVRLQLDDNFFRVRVARTTAAELAYLSAMADLGEGPYRSGDIALRLGRSGPEGVAPTRSRLIDKGLIFSPSYGWNDFTVPAFADFLRRNYPHPRRAAR